MITLVIFDEYFLMHAYAKIKKTKINSTQNIILGNKKDSLCFSWIVKFSFKLRIKYLNQRQQSV